MLKSLSTHSRYMARHPKVSTAGSAVVALEPEVVRDLLFGPPIYHLLITGAPMGEHLLEAAFGAVWEAIAAPPSRGRSGRPRATARRHRPTVIR